MHAAPLQHSGRGRRGCRASDWRGADEGEGDRSAVNRAAAALGSHHLVAADARGRVLTTRMPLWKAATMSMRRVNGRLARTPASG